MWSIVAQLALLWFVQAQPATIPLLRTGEVARQLTDADVAALELACRRVRNHGFSTASPFWSLMFNLLMHTYLR